MSDRVKRILERFSTATIRAAMAENPAVMTAAGWRSTPDGIAQTDMDDEGTVRLRESLKEIAMFPLLDTGMGLVSKIPAVQKFARAIARGIKRNSKEGRAIAENVKKALSKIDDLISKSDVADINPELRELLLDEGVPADVLTDSNLEKLTRGRLASLVNTADNAPSRFVIREGLIDGGGRTYDVIEPGFVQDNYHYPKNQVGYIQTEPSRYGDGPMVTYIENITRDMKTPAKGVSETAYNAVIQDKGSLVSGELLLSPEKTMKVLEKYPNKVHLGNYGRWDSWKSGETFNHPVYKLTEPTFQVPIKYGDVFSGEVIDDAGNFIVDYTGDAFHSMGGPLLRRFGEGGPIHIKPSHRGRLTELKERTGKTEAELYNDGNPAHKKMVVFARNSRKWHRMADGGLIKRYGPVAVREALQKMRGSHRYDGESEQTGRMNTAASQPWMQSSYLKLPENKPNIATNFVEESAPLVQLDDDAVYLGDIEPAVLVADRIRPEVGMRPRINMDDVVQLSEAIDSSNPNIMLRAVPSDLSPVTRNSLDREVLVRAGIKGDSIKDTSLNMLASLDDEARKNVKAELVSQGWYDVDANQILSHIKNRSDEAYRLQEHLRDLGYDIGKYGKNKDGVDGLIGRMTKAAIDKYVKEHKADALRDIASFGAFSDSQTADALARRVQYMQAHDKPSDEKSTKIEDSLLGEQNIGTQYDSQFDDYQVGGFDASNIYNVPVEEYGKASSPLSFKSFPKTCSTNECASAVTNFFLSNFGGDFIDKYNLRGDAWTMGENIVRAGGKRIFNLFDDAGAPRENNKNVTIKYVRQRAKDPEYKKMLSEGIGVGDIVELLYPNSPNFKKAYEESNGHNQNTHIGIVIEKDGELYVLDNSGGKYHHAKLSDVINGKEGRGVLITGAVSVNDGKDWRFGHNNESALYRADMSELGITPNEDYNKKVKDENGVGIKYHNYNNEAAYREMASLKRNSGKLMSSYGLNAEEFNKLAALTHAASMMETRNGSLAEGRKFRAESGNVSFGEGVGPLLQQFGRYTLPNMSEYVSSYIRGMEQDKQRRNGEDTTTASVLDKIPVIRKAFKPVSRGLTNVKADYHFTRDEQASLPVQGNYAEQPESSAIMGFSVLAKNYNHIKERLAGTKLGENKELLYTLTALAHNQGLNNIDTNIARYLSSGNEEELLQYMHREKKYRDALKKKDKKKAEYYNGPRYSRLMMDFTNYNKYNLVI